MMQNSRPRNEKSLDSTSFACSMFQKVCVETRISGKSVLCDVTAGTDTLLIPRPG